MRETHPNRGEPFTRRRVVWGAWEEDRAQVTIQRRHAREVVLPQPGVGDSLREGEHRGAGDSKDFCRAGWGVPKA